MTMGVYKRCEILSNKHFDDQDDRYVAIENALQNGFVLSDEAMSTLRPSLKEARTQLTKDVRYLKVMKPTQVERSEPRIPSETLNNPIFSDRNPTASNGFRSEFVGFLGTGFRQLPTGSGRNSSDSLVLDSDRKLSGVGSDDFRR
ncbi:unnamed protein product [Rotaria socialis]|uniref:Uncharacterized protein n=1 Tax=Rotaria socialis TaxID=392032 RepID=A0A817R908_9BILA|nr:unnamed protein product [Rotaria socialis]CAF4332482.1 unnamed protein product [Rotaria socialis]